MPLELRRLVVLEAFVILSLRLFHLSAHYGDLSREQDADTPALSSSTDAVIGRENLKQTISHGLHVVTTASMTTQLYTVAMFQLSKGIGHPPANSARRTRRQRSLRG